MNVAATAADPAPPASPPGWIRRNRGILLFLLLMVVFRSSFADWNQVPSTSMVPTIIAGDRILVNKMAYDFKLPLTGVSVLRLGEPQRGDIVVFNSKAADLRLIKRVVGLPGDVVSMRDNRLVINGQPVEYAEPKHTDEGLSLSERHGDLDHAVLWSKAGSLRLASFGPVEVPEDHYLVLGDNRNNSMDSRVYGLVPRSEIAGRAGAVAFSLDYDNYYLPRGDRFFRALD